MEVETLTDHPYASEIKTEGGTPSDAPQGAVVETAEPAQAHAEVVVDTPREEVKFDLNSELTKTFGKDAEGIKAELERSRTLEEQLKASPYKSEFAAQLDNFLEKNPNVNPEVAVRYLTADPKSLKAKEVLAFDMKVDPANTLTDEQISRYIDRKYGLGEYAKKTEEGEVDPLFERDALENLEVDAGKVRKNWDEVKAKMLPPPAEKREQVQAQISDKQRISSWEKKTKDLIEDSISIPVGEKDGKPLASVKVKLRNKEAVLTDLNKFVANTKGLEFGEEGEKFLKNEIIPYLVWKHEQKHIAHALVGTGESNKDKVWSKILHNPQLGNAPPHEIGAAKESDAYDRMSASFSKR